MFRHWDILIWARNGVNQRHAFLSSCYQRTAHFLSSRKYVSGLSQALLTALLDDYWLQWILISETFPPLAVAFYIYYGKMTQIMNWSGLLTVGISSAEESLVDTRTEIYINPNTLLNTTHTNTHIDENTDVNYQKTIATSVSNIHWQRDDMMKYSVNKWVSDQ